MRFDRKTYNRAYYKDNKEKLNKESSEWYVNNKEKAKALSKINYEKNKERAKKNAKIWKKHNRQKVRDSNKRWARAHPEQFAKIKKAQQLKKVFWTVEKYDEAFEAQKGLCAICKETQKKRLSADHDHETSIPRELICNRCNLMLGRVNDSPSTLEAAAAYLRKHGKK